MINTELMLDFIRFVVRAKGYKQKELAKKMGISRSHLSELLSGKAEFTLAKFCQLGYALYIRPHELLAIGEVKGVLVPSVFEGHASIHALNLITLYSEVSSND